MADTSSSVVDSEVEQFARLAADWWDPDGSSALLLMLKPVSIGYFFDSM